MRKVTRKILVEISVDWEGYEDVDAELMLEDVVGEVPEGTTLTIIYQNEDYHEKGISK